MRPMMRDGERPGSQLSCHNGPHCAARKRASRRVPCQKDFAAGALRPHFLEIAEYGRPHGIVQGKDMASTDFRSTEDDCSFLPIDVAEPQACDLAAAHAIQT